MHLKDIRLNLRKGAYKISNRYHYQIRESRRPEIWLQNVCYRLTLDVRFIAGYYAPNKVESYVPLEGAVVVVSGQDYIYVNGSPSRISGDSGIMENM